MSGSSDSETLDEEEGNQGVTGSGGATGYGGAQGYGSTQGFQWAQGNGSAAGYGGFQCYSNAPGYGGVPGCGGAHGYESTLESQVAQRYDGTPGNDEGPTELLDFYNENPEEEAKVQAKHTQEGKGHPEKKPKGRAAVNKKKAAQAADGKQNNQNNQPDNSKDPNKIPNQGGGSGTRPKRRLSSSKQSSCTAKTSKTIRECSKTEQQDLKQAVEVKAEASAFDMKTESTFDIRQSQQRLRQQQLQINHLAFTIEALEGKVTALQSIVNGGDARSPVTRYSSEQLSQADSLLPASVSQLPSAPPPVMLPPSAPVIPPLLPHTPQQTYLGASPPSSQPYPGFQPTVNHAMMSTPPYQFNQSANETNTRPATANDSSGGVSLSDTSDLIAGNQGENLLFNSNFADSDYNDLRDFIYEHLDSTDGLDPHEMNQALVNLKWGEPTAQFEAAMQSCSGQTSGGDHSYEGK